MKVPLRDLCYLSCYGYRLISLSSITAIKLTRLRGKNAIRFDILFPIFSTRQKQRKKVNFFGLSCFHLIWRYNKILKTGQLAFICRQSLHAVDITGCFIFSTVKLVFQKIIGLGPVVQKPINTNPPDYTFTEVFNSLVKNGKERSKLKNIFFGRLFVDL